MFILLFALMGAAVGSAWMGYKKLAISLYLLLLGIALFWFFRLMTSGLNLSF